MYINLCLSFFDVENNRVFHQFRKTEYIEFPRWLEKKKKNARKISEKVLSKYLYINQYWSKNKKKKGITKISPWKFEIKKKNKIIRYFGKRTNVHKKSIPLLLCILWPLIYPLNSQNITKNISDDVGVCPWRITNKPYSEKEKCLIYRWMFKDFLWPS